MTAHLFQAQIPKTGVVRVTVVGCRVFAQRIAAPDGALDWRCGDWDALVHAPIAVPAPIEAVLHRYLEAIGLVFSRCTAALHFGRFSVGA